MSWLNSWIQAAPLYHQAEVQFEKRHLLSKALYARVSEMPAHSEGATSVPAQIALLRDDLLLPEAHDPETRLRVLTILGMLETNYDAGMARETWTQIESLALRQRHFLLASRAIGEQGIAAFLLGDMATAKKDVVKAWMVAKTADPAAHIRYASMYGTGLVELHKYNEALGPLNEAIPSLPRFACADLRFASPFPLHLALPLQGWVIPLPLRLATPAFARRRSACSYMPMA
jgi:hypothetical protein